MSDFISMGKVDSAAKKSSGTASRYATEEYAREFLTLLQRWRNGKHSPLLVPAESTGMQPAALRVAMYNARAFMREHPQMFDADSLDLVNSASLELSHKPRGVLIRRRAGAFNLSRVAMEISRESQDDVAYQNLMQWIGSEHELDEKFELEGPFNAHDYERFRNTITQLHGIYLSVLTPLKLTLIFHPGGK